MTEESRQTALEEFRAFARSLAEPVDALEPWAEELRPDLDPALPGTLPPTLVWSRFACLAVAGGPCPANRLRQCHRNCWRKPRKQQTTAQN